MTFSFLDHVVVNATKSEHFSDDELPELPDYDDAAHLRTFGIPVSSPSTVVPVRDKPADFSLQRLDPFQGAQQRHVAFNMLWLFRTYCKGDLRDTQLMMESRPRVFGDGCCLDHSKYRHVHSTICAEWTAEVFNIPVLVHILISSRYFEDNSHPTLSPWIWIVGMSAGPLLVSLSLQWYSYYATTILYRAEALLVELVFEHSLRTRLKAEGDSSNHDGPTGTKPISGPLVGKINTLITVDVANIGEAKDFLILGKCSP